MPNLDEKTKQAVFSASRFLTVSDFRRADPISYNTIYGRWHLRIEYLSHMKTKSEITEQDILDHASKLSMEEFFNNNRVLAGKAASDGYLLDIMQKLKWVK